jgi:hypothetical protein
MPIRSHYRTAQVATRGERELVNLQLHNPVPPSRDQGG